LSGGQKGEKPGDLVSKDVKESNPKKTEKSKPRQVAEDTKKQKSFTARQKAH